MTATSEHPLDPSAIECRCPRCGTELWAERGGDYTLKARILRYQGGAFVGVCPECRGEVPIPWLKVSADPTTHQGPPRRRYVVRALDTAKPSGQR